MKINRLILLTPLQIYIYIDEDTHISNAVYALDTNIEKELTIGWDKFSSFGYGTYHVSAPFEKVKDIQVICDDNVKSDTCIGVQASDILVGTYRKIRIVKEEEFQSACTKITSVWKLP